MLPKPGAVLFGKDLPRLARFYEGTAGLVVTLEERALIVLESPLQQLVLHGIPPRIARNIEIAVPPKLRTDTAVKLVFPVASIDDARAKAVALGGAVGPKNKEFDVRGVRACDGHDPEGNVIQFRAYAD